MRLLVTNDDGIGAKGISNLASVAIDTGMDITVAAPCQERSGSSAALIMSADVAPERVTMDPHSSVRAYRVAASPAMIAVMACHGAFGPEPDLVLSGINHGPNTGRAVLHSGTVGAAFTAASHGIPAIAFSHVGTAPETWATAELVARRVIDWGLTHWRDPSLVLNVNIPNCVPERLKGLRFARLSTFGAAQAQRENGLRSDAVTVSPGMDPPEMDTDDVLLAADYATVTPVAAPCEHAAELTELLGAALCAHASA